MPRYGRRPAKGLTLIELVVALLIIAVIAFIAIPRFGGVRDDAHVAAMRADLAQLQVAMDACYEEEGSYEGCNGDLVTPTEGVTLRILERSEATWAAEAEHRDVRTRCVYHSEEGRVECNGVDGG